MITTTRLHSVGIRLMQLAGIGYAIHLVVAFFHSNLQLWAQGQVGSRAPLGTLVATVSSEVALITIGPAMAVVFILGLAMYWLSKEAPEATDDFEDGEDTEYTDDAEDTDDVEGAHAVDAESTETTANTEKTEAKENKEHT